MLPVRFLVILRWLSFSRVQARTLISWPSRERSFYNFSVRPLPKLVIWPKYAIRAISRDSEKATPFARPIALANIPFPPDSAPFIIFVRNRFQYSLFGLYMLLVRFRDDNLFCAPTHTHKYPDSPRTAPFIIFPHDRFQYSLFGLNMLPEQFHVPNCAR